MTRHFCSTLLGAVHYVDTGPREGTPFVLLHQTPRSIDEFAEVIPLLARARRVIAVDTPGYGCSDHPATPPGIGDYAAAVIAVLDAAGCDRAIVVGHHTGAVIAVELAAAFPSRVEAVALSGPVYVGEENRRALAPFFTQWHVRADGSHLSEKWNKFREWLPEPALVQRLIIDLVRAGETSESGHLAILDYRMEDRLPLARCPGLLVYGSRDPFTSRDAAAPFRAALRPVQEVTIDGGVFLPTEAPERYAEVLLEWSGG